MNRQERRAANAHLRKENAKQSDELEMVPTKDWPRAEPGMFALFRSKKFLVQVYHEKNDIIRLSVCRTQINSKGQWEENITWEELQEIKKQCGLDQLDAVEIYPAGEDVVNVANMRHLWCLPTRLPYAWRNDQNHRD